MSLKSLIKRPKIKVITPDHQAFPGLACLFQSVRLADNPVITL